jgi:hypothetical protein
LRNAQLIISVFYAIEDGWRLSGSFEAFKHSLQKKKKNRQLTKQAKQSKQSKAIE